MIAAVSFLDYNTTLGTFLKLDNLVLLQNTKESMSFCPPVLVVGCTRLCRLTFELGQKFLCCPLTLFANEVLDHGQASLRTGPLDSTLGRSASHTPCVVPGPIVQGYTQVTERQGWFVVLGHDLGRRTASTEGTTKLSRVEKLASLSVAVPLFQAPRLCSLVATRTPTGGEERMVWDVVETQSTSPSLDLPRGYSAFDTLEQRGGVVDVFGTEGERVAVGLASEDFRTVLGE